MAEPQVIPVHVARDRFESVPELGRLRAEQPVSRLTTPAGTAWLVTRYEDVREVLGDATRFGNDPVDHRSYASIAVSGHSGEGAGTAPPRHGFLLAYDPPDHTRLRRLLTPEFTVRRIQRLAPRIERIVTDHLDAMEEAGPPADLVPAFALPVPSLVICELLGVPYADREDFQRLSRARLDMGLPLEERAAAARASQAYMAGLVAKERRDPGEEMLGMLVREHGQEVDDQELTGVADLLLLAGHETTSNMLGLGTLFLLQDPARVALMREEEHVETAVEELLRHLSVVHTVMPRYAREDVVLGGQEIKAGEMIAVSLPAANHDTALLEDPGHLDLTRKIIPHVAFGHGVHHCLGASLARMEMRIAYPALLRRFPGLRAAVPIEEIAFRAFSVIYGVESLPVEW
ncbi:cytochrome P450 [Sphaerisporangium sp. NPDC004334]